MKYRKGTFPWREGSSPLRGGDRDPEGEASRDGTNGQPGSGAPAGRVLTRVRVHTQRLDICTSWGFSGQKPVTKLPHWTTSKDGRPVRFCSFSLRFPGARPLTAVRGVRHLRRLSRARFPTVSSLLLRPQAGPLFRRATPDPPFCPLDKSSAGQGRLLAPDARRGFNCWATTRPHGRLPAQTT